MSKNKPSFVNPAAAFITIPKESEVPDVQSNRIQDTEEDAVQGVPQDSRTKYVAEATVHRLRPPETKAQRLELRVRPSTFNNIKRAAAMNKMSINEAVHQILDDFFVQDGGGR
jgi:predicted HicB family RNase H-like nuclease